MREVYHLRLAPEAQHYRIEPFPGSDAARAKDCTCPTLQPWPGGYAIASDCPEHELKRAVN